MLSVIMPNVVRLNVVMLSVVMLNVVMLSVVFPNAAEESFQLTNALAYYFAASMPTKKSFV
jgi:hypothetical protein